MSQIVNCQYVHDSFSMSQSLAAGTAQQAANMEYVLKCSDLATGTSYGSNATYATKRMADQAAVDTLAGTRTLLASKGPYSNDYIYRSTNGLTWDQVATQAQWEFIGTFYNQSNVQTIVAANSSNGYSYYSTDKGVTWTQNSYSGGVYAIAQSTTNPNILVATGSGVLQRSSNYGQTWTQIIMPTIPPGLWGIMRNITALSNLFIIVGPTGGLLISGVNDGLNWDFVDFSPYTWNESNGAIRAVKGTTTDGQVILSAMGTNTSSFIKIPDYVRPGYWCGTQIGGTLTLMPGSNGDITAQNVQSMTSRSGTNPFIAGRWNQQYLYSDNGINWVSAYKRNSYTGGVVVRAVKNEIWAVGPRTATYNDQLVRSLDGGTNWRNISQLTWLGGSNVSFWVLP